MYVSFLRHLLLMEEGEDLHLAPATPRKWLAQPEPIGVENAPSQFGPVTYHLVADPDRTTIRGDVRLDPERKPARLLVHIRAPGGRGLRSVKVNGEDWWAFDDDRVIIPNPPAEVTLEARIEE